MLIYTIRDIVGLTVAALLILSFGAMWLLIAITDWLAKRRRRQSHGKDQA